MRTKYHQGYPQSCQAWSKGCWVENGLRSISSQPSQPGLSKSYFIQGRRKYLFTFPAGYGGAGNGIPDIVLVFVDELPAHSLRIPGPGTEGVPVDGFAAFGKVYRVAGPVVLAFIRNAVDEGGEAGGDDVGGVGVAHGFGVGGLTCMGGIV